MIKVCLHQIDKSESSSQYPFGNCSMPFINSHFCQVEKASGDRQCAKQQPQSSKQLPLKTLECVISIANSGDRHDSAIKCINPMQLLQVHHHLSFDHSAEDGDTECKSHFDSDAHAIAMLGIQHIFLGYLVMATFHSREEKMLLLVHHVCHHATH